MKYTKIFTLLLVFSLVAAFDTEADGYDIGDTVADFSLMNIDGNQVSLSNYDNAKGFLVIFTCNTCPYAVAYEDRIIALDAKYKDQGVPVIAIMPNNTEIKPGDSFENMKKRAADKGFSFPYLLDEDQEIFPQFGATRTPHTYLIEKTDAGNVVRYIGAIDDNYQDASQVETTFVEDAVDAMLAGNPIQVTTTKAIGCTIKV